MVVVVVVVVDEKKYSSYESCGMDRVLRSNTGMVPGFGIVHLKHKRTHTARRGTLGLVLYGSFTKIQKFRNRWNTDGFATGVHLRIGRFE